MQATRFDDVEGKIDFAIRTGALNIRYFAVGKEGALNNYAAYLSNTDEFGAPRHKHNFEQMRFVLKGQVSYGKDFITPAGTVLYVPEGVFYGPQEREPGTRQFTVQFGGASGQGYVSKEQRIAAKTELEKTGKFEKGYYSWVDAEGRRHNQDSFEICYEKAMGRPVVYPEPRFGDMIAMKPENYGWVEDGKTGVAWKWMGTFSERGTRIGMVKVKAGASLPGGTHAGPELFFLAKGHASVNGETYPIESVFAFETKEGPIPVKAEEECEYLCLRMPAF